MNVLTPVKNFIRMDRENKAARLCMIGFLGIFAAVILSCLKLLPDTLTVELVIGIFVVVLGSGCLMMTSVLIKHNEKAARLAGGGAFTLVGLICAEATIDYLVEHLTSVSLPQITAWYAFPCLTLFFIGILMLIGQVISDAWKRA